MKVSSSHIRWLLVLLPCAMALCSLMSCKSVTLSKAELYDHTGRYALAADSYYTLYRRTSRKKPERRAYLAFKAAENYRRLGNTPRALNCYNLALSGDYPDSILHLRIAQELQQLGRWREAGKAYEQFLEYYPHDYFGRIGLASVRQADSLLAHPTGHTVETDRLLISPYAEFAPCYAPDGTILYFTSSRVPLRDMLQESEVTGLGTNNLYMIKQDASGKWSRPDSVPGSINTPEDEGTPSITADGNTLYYSYAEQSSTYDRTVQIYKASKSSQGGWGRGERVPIWEDSLRMAAHPAIDASGRYLYFVSEGAGLGGKDLYRILLSEHGWGKPENLGNEINTPGDELFPTMVGDSTLYFSSNGRVGLGGLDLYKAQMDSLGGWQVTHLGAPMNSPADDYALTFAPKPQSGLAEEGYLSSTRGDQRGRPHLYRFSLPATIIRIDGFVMDREGYGIPQATVRIADEQGLLATPIVSTRDDGSFVLEIAGSNRYVLHASHPDYLNQYMPLVTDSATESTDYLVDFYLASRLHSEQIHDIYYDFDRASLRPEGKKSLDYLVTLLEQNPDVRLELSSNTDRKGSQAYNQKLSQRRAQSVVDYLIAKGVVADRLEARGYGKERPYVVTKGMAARFAWLPEGQELTAEWVGTLTEEQQVVCDQLNRRTEFTVIQ
ncbi:MAG: OmpA family protein [Porphyromonas sp.]|uniref:PorE family type IX secretion system protein n=1 Tax=Porphyromonas sp. TaxID=1924944 RepID=UPI002A74E0DB|nr:OmpA family protein [Porphyromonas sp.]MDD6928462.1 OmpA family protein [Bacteroidales bacterium]MDY3111608.1 OmpA family protein [Porphyromonas sp.]